MFLCIQSDYQSELCAEGHIGYSLLFINAEGIPLEQVQAVLNSLVAPFTF